MANFEQWLTTTTELHYIWEIAQDKHTINNYIKTHKKEIDYLNSLIGKKEININKQLDNNQRLQELILLLINARKKELTISKNGTGCYYDFRMPLTNTAEEYMIFLNKLGIIKMLQEKTINSVVDYVKFIEREIETIYKNNKQIILPNKIVYNFLKNIEPNLFTSISINNLSILTKTILTDKEELNNHVFDYVIVKEDVIYLIDTIFINIHGSRPIDNIIYKTYISKLLSNYDNFKYALIIDGQGCCLLQHYLKKLFLVNSNIFNLNDLQNNKFTNFLKNEN